MSAESKSSGLLMLIISDILWRISQPSINIYGEEREKVKEGIDLLNKAARGEQKLNRASRLFADVDSYSAYDFATKGLNEDARQELYTNSMSGEVFNKYTSLLEEICRDENFKVDSDNKIILKEAQMFFKRLSDISFSYDMSEYKTSNKKMNPQVHILSLV